MRIIILKGFESIKKVLNHFKPLVIILLDLICDDSQKSFFPAFKPFQNDHLYYSALNLLLYTVNIIFLLIFQLNLYLILLSFMIYLCL